MIKAVVINASPRKSGNSSHISEYIMERLEGKAEVTYYVLREMEFTGCIDCGYCQRNRGCVIRDDLHDMYRVFDESDITITITPIYFDGTPWKLKAMIDRMQAIYNSKYVLEDSLIDRSKPRSGFVVCHGGAPEYETQFEGNRNVLQFMYRSINTELAEHIKAADTDASPVYENEKILSQIDRCIDDLIHVPRIPPPLNYLSRNNESEGGGMNRFMSDYNTFARV